MTDIKLFSLNILTVVWGAAVWLTDLNFIIGVIGGLALLWANIEKAITERKKRK